ncbi:MAG: CaiB/BaiF CoA transferase family protein [Planctomycetaceae bacterium]
MIPPSRDSSAGHSHPLQGVRVLDLTRVLAGPYCTMILADLGADVVKVEHPQTGDDARHFGPFLPSGLSGYFASINRGKKSLALDLKDEVDRQTFLRLVEAADVLVENFRPGTMAKWGLDAGRLCELNPRLIYASLSGFGQTGPDRDRPAYDVIVQALSGLMSITGEGPGRFVRVGTSIGDILTGLYGAIAVLAALNGRADSGEGCVIDLAMLDCTVSALENAVCRYSVTGEVPQPLGGRHPSITPFQSFPTADGPIVIAAGNDGLWRRLCEVLEAPEWIEDPRFFTNAARTENQQELDRLLSARLQMQSRNAWLDRLSIAGVPAAPIRNVADVVADPHLQARGIWHEMRDGSGSPFLTAGSPLRTNGAPPPLGKTAPDLDGDREDVLARWLG